MKSNMGSADRGIRAAIAVLIGGLYFTGMINGIVAVFLTVVAVVFILTSAVGTCPAYVPLGLSTKKRDGSA